VWLSAQHAQKYVGQPDGGQPEPGHPAAGDVQLRELTRWLLASRTGPKSRLELARAALAGGLSFANGNAVAQVPAAPAIGPGHEPKLLSEECPKDALGDGKTWGLWLCGRLRNSRRVAHASCGKRRLFARACGRLCWQHRRLASLPAPRASRSSAIAFCARLSHVLPSQKHRWKCRNEAWARERC
ncbi:unnamed protein product, partial [Effrenium voratum]